MKIKVYVEGGGQTKALRTKCRRGFSAFFSKAGLSQKPAVVACGTRNDAYDDFCTAVKTVEADTLPLLLVDSEASVANGNTDAPWDHLKTRDGWNKPNGAAENQAHLMVLCMESWFMADKDALAEFFGNGFHRNSLPRQADIEAIPKATLYSCLKNAARPTKKKTYGKGDHSFGILAMVDPQKVQEASQWAKRLITTLKEKL